MHRFYALPESCRGENITLTGAEAHQALHVLRVRRGEQVIVLDGAGMQLTCEVGDCRRDHVEVHVLERRSVSLPRCRMTLLQSLPRGKLIESIIQKATELGVARVVPLLAERTTTRLDEEAIGRKTEKWESVAIEAIKQCGLAWLPAVEPALTPQAFLQRKESFDLAFIASLRPGSRHARQYFHAFENAHRDPPRSIALWIGPEGDFTADEAEAIEAAGALPITLGPLVLRVETAAVYSLSIINYEVQSWGDRAGTRD